MRFGEGLFSARRVNEADREKDGRRQHEQERTATRFEHPVRRDWSAMVLLEGLTPANFNSGKGTDSHKPHSVGKNGQELGKSEGETEMRCG